MNQIAGTRFLCLMLFVFLVCMSSLPVVAASKAPLVRRQGQPTGVYIVSLKEKAPSAIPGLAKSIAASYSGELRYIFDSAMGGFSLSISPEDLERMREDPRVAFVEEDVKIRWDIGDGGLSATVQNTHDQSGYLWYLDRIDERYIDPATNTLDGGTTTAISEAASRPTSSIRV